MNKVFIGLIMLVIVFLCSIYLPVMSSHSESRKSNYARDVVRRFSINLHDYCLGAENPVIFTDVRMMIDELVSPKYAKYDNKMPILIIEFLEDLKDGKDIYDTDYYLKVDSEKGEVVLISSIQDELQPEGVENIQSVTKVDFSKVKVLDANGNQQPTE